MYTDKLATILGHAVAIEPLPLHLRYGSRRLRAEAAKALVGAVLCFAAIALLSPVAVIAWPIAAVGVLFLVYLAQQARRRGLRLELTAEGLRREAHGLAAGLGGAQRLDWRALERFRLKFYPHRRRSMQGTLVLDLRGGGERLKLDSSLEGFPTLLLHAAAAARERELRLDSTTEANLAQLGLQD